MHCTCTKEGIKEATWFSQACFHSSQQHSHFTLLASHTPLGASSYISQQMCLQNALRIRHRGFIYGDAFQNHSRWQQLHVGCKKEVLVKRFWTWKYSPKMFPQFLRPKAGSGRTSRHFSSPSKAYPISTACREVAAKLTTNRQDLLCLKLGRLDSSTGKDLLAWEGRCKGSLCGKRPARQRKA